MPNALRYEGMVYTAHGHEPRLKESGYNDAAQADRSKATDISGSHVFKNYAMRSIAKSFP